MLLIIYQTPVYKGNQSNFVLIDVCALYSEYSMNLILQVIHALTIVFLLQIKYDKISNTNRY